jgi:hypothetical protein
MCRQRVAIRNYMAPPHLLRHLKGIPQCFDCSVTRQLALLYAVLYHPAATLLPLLASYLMLLRSPGCCQLLSKH